MPEKIQAFHTGLFVGKAIIEPYNYLPSPEQQQTYFAMNDRATSSCKPTRRGDQCFWAISVLLYMYTDLSESPAVNRFDVCDGSIVRVVRLNNKGFLKKESQEFSGCLKGFRLLGTSDCKTNYVPRYSICSNGLKGWYCHYARSVPTRRIMGAASSCNRAGLKSSATRASYDTILFPASYPAKECVSRHNISSLCAFSHSNVRWPTRVNWRWEVAFAATSKQFWSRSHSSVVGITDSRQRTLSAIPICSTQYHEMEQSSAFTCSLNF